VGSRGIYVADTGNNRVQSFDPFRGGRAAATPFRSRGALSTEVTPALSQPNAVAAVVDFRQEKIYVADTGNNRVVLVNMPIDNPETIWATMKQLISLDDIAGAVS